MKKIFQRKNKSRAVVAAVDASSSNSSLLLGLSAVLPTGERAKIPSTTSTRRTFGSNTTRTTPHHTVQSTSQEAGAVTAEDTLSSFDCISTIAVCHPF